MLLHLAEEYDVKRIIQIAYYRPSTFNRVSIDGKEVSVPYEVTGFFRDIQNIQKMKSKVKWRSLILHLIKTGMLITRKR